MEGRGEGPGRPLDPRDWEATRGAQQEAETRPAAPQPTMPSERPPEDVPENIRAQTREGEDPYLWHSGRTREHGAEDAVEFIDVHKAFGRNTILNGLNLGLPDGQISLISSSPLSVCWRSGKAVLSNTFIEPNSAPSWNSTPNFLRISNSWSSAISGTDSPWTSTSPWSG